MTSGSNSISTIRAGSRRVVAWGGFAGIKHLTQYLQPGLDLITLDPKHSATIIGPEAFGDDATLNDIAKRLALDVGVLNQEGCVNCSGRLCPVPVPTRRDWRELTSWASACSPRFRACPTISAPRTRRSIRN